MVRLFVAVELAQNIVDVLKNLQSELSVWDLSKTSSFHLTLEFIGEVDEKMIPEILEALSAVRFSKFDLELDSVGVFPARNNPRVVWVGVTPKDSVVKLANAVAMSLKPLDIVPDHEFNPHLTLARVRFLENKADFVSLLDSLKVPKVSFEVSSFKLLSSTLTPKGHVYAVIKEFPAIS
jgi:2'-5' RNA ligase